MYFLETIWEDDSLSVRALVTEENVNSNGMVAYRYKDRLRYDDNWDIRFSHGELDTYAFEYLKIIMILRSC